MRTLLLLVFSLISHAVCVKAQSLQTTVDKINALDKASFTEIVKFKFSFQESFSIDTFKTDVIILPTEKQIGSYYRIQGKNDTYLFDGTKAIHLNLQDTTYTMTNKAVGNQYTRTLPYWKNKIATYLLTPSKIKHVVDTVINNIAYNHFVVIITDTIKKNEHVYDHTHIITTKATGLPYIMRTQGIEFGNDGASIGMFEEHTFTNYQLKKSNFPNLSAAMVPQGFKLPVKKQPMPMLAAGTVAPDIKLTDLAGKSFAISSLRSKIVLLNFTTDGCPHCVNAAKMLKQLAGQYQSKGLEIVSIYNSNFNTIGSVTKFDAKNNVRYPSYMTDAAAATTYHVNGYPNFYLLDRQGLIVQSFDGFYASLEKELSDKIDTLK